MIHLSDIVDKFKDVIYTTAFYHLGHRDDADDVTQEVLIRIWDNIDKLREDTLKAWIVRVTKNACVDFSRRNRRYRTYVANNDFDTSFQSAADERPGPRSIMENLELKKNIMSALSKLHDPYRTILILREIQGLTYLEIAEVLEMNLSKVKVCLHRGRSMLREKLKETMPYESIART